MKVPAQGLVAVALVLASVTTAWARDESLDDLKAKLKSATVADQPKICLAIAKRQLEAADKAFSAGKFSEGKTLVEEVVSYAQQAGDASLKSRKHMKDTEIEVRKLSKRLRDITPTLDIEDRPQMLQAVERLEHIRTELLMSMFSKN